MKKLVLGLILIISSVSSNAQLNIPYTVQKSEVFKDEFTNSKIISIEQDKNGGVVIIRSFMGGVLQMTNMGYCIEHYDANMKLIKDYKYRLQDNTLLGLFIKDEKVYMFNVVYQQEYKGYAYTVSTADIHDFNFTSKELFRIKCKKVRYPGITNIHKPNNGQYAKIILNDKKTSFAFSISLKDQDSGDEMNKIYVYDMDLNLKIEHLFEEEARNFRYNSIETSEDGSAIYILGKFGSEQSRNKEEGGNYEYQLTRITNSGSKSITFGIGEHYARSLKTVLKGDRIACAGFYSNIADNRYKGVCYFDINTETLELKTSKYNPFTEEFMIDKYGKDKDKELKALTVKDIFINDKNEIIMNAEENFKVNSGNGMGNYHYDDIMSVRIADNGDLLWARNINKRQDSAEPNEFLSYTSMIKGDDTFFFINTSETLRRLRNDRIEFGQTSQQNSNLNIIRVNKDGDFDFKEVLNSDDNEVPFMVADGAKTKNGNSIYFLGRSGKKKQLLKLSI